MSDTTNPQPDLSSQLREIGDQFKTLLQSAWNSDEAHQVKEELKSGLNELGRTATEAVEEFKASEPGQKLKTEADNFKTRLERGEVEAKARAEISKTLKVINTELQKAIASFSTPIPEED